jgi:hypothetical protein
MTDSQKFFLILAVILSSDAFLGTRPALRRIMRHNTFLSWTLPFAYMAFVIWVCWMVG